MTYASGSAGPLRGDKGTTWEGGMRVPCIMRWPGKIPAGVVSHEVATTMDLLPTIAALTGTEIPDDRTIDGKDIRALLFDEEGATSPHVAFYYYRDDRLQAVRSGRWKLHVYRPEWEERNTLRASLCRCSTTYKMTSVRRRTSPPNIRTSCCSFRRWPKAPGWSLGDAVTGQEGTDVRPVG